MRILINVAQVCAQRLDFQNRNTTRARSSSRSIPLNFRVTMFQRNDGLRVFNEREQYLFSIDRKFIEISPENWQLAILNEKGKPLLIFDFE